MSLGAACPGPPENEQAALRAMAHPVRLRIMSLLTGAPLTAAEVARELGITHANASYHLRNLLAGGLIVSAGEEKIRGGVAKRYRYDTDHDQQRRRGPMTDEQHRMAYTAIAHELIRRGRHADQPGRPHPATQAAGTGARAHGRIGRVTIPNVLAARYASTELAALWSPQEKIRMERRLWLAVLRAQRDLGVAVPDGAVEAYEAVLDNVDLASIAARERITRHDVKARIEEFSALAGFEQIHKGMTSRDLTENVEQLQIRASLLVIRDRVVAALARLAALAVEHSDLVMTGRSHNVAAQATTLGKRFASACGGAADRVRAARRPDRHATRCAASRARSAPPPTSSTCSTATSTRWPALEQRVAGAPRLQPGARPASARSTPDPWTSTWSRRWPRSSPVRPRWPPRSA